MSGEPTFHTYGNWRRPRETGLLGATFGTSIAAIGAAATVIIAGLFFGLKVTVLLAIPVIVCFIPLVISRDGRSGYERALMRLQFWRARRRGEHTYASGTFSRVPGRAYRLPGVLADTELYEGIDSGGRTFGMIHMPSRGAYTVVFDAYPQGAEAVDQDVIDHYVGNWAQFLSAAGGDLGHPRGGHHRRNPARDRHRTVRDGPPEHPRRRPAAGPRRGLPARHRADHGRHPPGSPHCDHLRGPDHRTQTGPLRAGRRARPPAARPDGVGDTGRCAVLTDGCRRGHGVRAPILRPGLARRCRSRPALRRRHRIDLGGLRPAHRPRKPGRRQIRPRRRGVGDLGDARGPPRAR